jgi:chemotaxis protein CheX
MELVSTKMDVNGTRKIGACVQITGAWEGAVEVDCSFELARVATARFLAVDPAEVKAVQIYDAMGELANMSAGSVKPVLPGPSQLSLPSVADGTDYTLTIPRGDVIAEARFEFRGEPLKITVMQGRVG